MKLPRFTLRRAMVLVAAMGLVFGAYTSLSRRSARYHEIAEHHLSEGSSGGRALFAGGSCRLINARGEVVSDERRLWLLQMAVKYHNAAKYPWLPVTPDPAMPE